MAPSLLTLPPELRNLVYANVLPIGNEETQVFRFSFSVAPKVPAILQVNKQIRREALSLYYGTSHFELILHWRGVWQFAQWANALSQEAVDRLLRNDHVTIRVIFDKFHADYDKMERYLGNWSIPLDAGRKSWWATAETSRRERGFTGDMVKVNRAGRDMRGASTTTTRVRKEPHRFVSTTKTGGEREEGRKLVRAQMSKIVDKVLDVFEA